MGFRIKCTQSINQKCGSLDWSYWRVIMVVRHGCLEELGVYHKLVWVSGCLVQ